MKRLNFPFIFMLVICLLVTTFASAKVWRVNNKSNYNGSSLWGDNFGGTAAYPVFAQISQAVSFGIVNNGDTLHIEGSTVIYTFGTITKKLVIIGTGYYLTDNPATSNSTLSSKIEYIVFNNGSQGSQLIGFDVVNNGNTADGYVYVSVNDITVKRCRIERAVRFETLLTDVFILQNFFPNNIVTNCLATNGNSFFIPPTGIIFNNNICQKTLTWGTPLANPTTFWPISECHNNVFDGPDNLATPNLAFTTSEFKNNILMPTNAVVNIPASSGVIAYNIGTLSTQFGTTDNNLVVPAITTLFTSSPSKDGTYQVAPASVAANSGSDATDRGAFGGAAVTNRYTLSGLAPIPVIYKITTAGVANASGLPVTISARTIK
ncbi:hypothetical protein BH11BAC3_BH11BAC3_05070 [soil metagenome]